jgi:hypothetical protein
MAAEFGPGGSGIGRQSVAVGQHTAWAGSGDNIVPMASANAASYVQKVRIPNQAVAAIKTIKLVAAATMKQRSIISMGRSLHAHGKTASLIRAMSVSNDRFGENNWAAVWRARTIPCSPRGLPQKCEQMPASRD